MTSTTSHALDSSQNERPRCDGRHEWQTVDVVIVAMKMLADVGAAIWMRPDQHVSACSRCGLVRVHDRARSVVDAIDFSAARGNAP